MDIAEMKFIVDGRQIIDLINGQYRGKLHEITRKQCLWKTEKTSEELAIELKELLERLGREIAV